MRRLTCSTALFLGLFSACVDLSPPGQVKRCAQGLCDAAGEPGGPPGPDGASPAATEGGSSGATDGPAARDQRPLDAPPGMGEAGARADGPAGPAVDGVSPEAGRDTPLPPVQDGGPVDAPLVPDGTPDLGPLPADGPTPPDFPPPPPDVPPPPGAGAACTGTAQCGAGLFCVDGVCCNTVCGGSCQACNLPGSAGTCTPIPGGDDPANECMQDDVATCRQDGACDGRGACRFYAGGTACGPSSCSGTTYTPPRTCDGAGTCQTVTPSACGGYSCGPAGACLTRCAAPADCATAFLCEGGACVPPKALGATCAAAGECASGFCEQGVCCASACTGSCRSCALGGNAGTCTNVPTGQDPLAQCADQGASSCGTDGACDGSGGCRLFAVGTVCAAQTCTNDSYTPPRTCDGAGTCRTVMSTPCEPFACSAPDGACRKRCNSDADCVAGSVCLQRSCTRKKTGTACGADNECASGFCKQGVCCATACDGLCQSCNLGGTVGTCTTVPAGQDPQSQCADQGASSCGTDGSCDGAGACRLYASGTVCAAQACAGSTETSARTCDGAGVCRAATTRGCAPYACGAGGACLSSCAGSGECVSPNVCNGGSCGPKPNGTACAAGNECASGICAQGVCCNAACTGTCQACNLAGTLGTCSSVPDGQDPLDQCADQGATSCGTDGTCNGSGTCRLYKAGTVCAPGSCSGGAETSPRTCSGGGACQAATMRSCAPYVCGTDGKCLASCQGPGDCVSPNTCNGTSCGLKSNGSACGGDGECLSAQCEQGVCCNTDCSSTCKVCNLASSLGTCVNVPDGQDLLDQCADDGSASCGNDGACNGNGACRKYASGTVCAAAACSTGSYSATKSCNGTGSCQGPSPVACGKYVCTATGCKTSCASTADCVSPSVCSAAACGGLRVTYYDNIDFTGATVIRTDATVNFDWGSSATPGVGSPDPAIAADTFSGRWTGKITPKFSETYTFFTISDDGVRLWVNNQLVINQWYDHAPTEHSGTIFLNANQAYDIKIEWYENGGQAVMKLSWSSASQPKEIVPTAALTP